MPKSSSSLFIAHVEGFLIRFLRVVRKISQRSDRNNPASWKLIEIDDVQVDDNYSDTAIVITTFEPRLFDYALPLIQSIRSVTEIPIIVVINGNYSSSTNRRLLHRLMNELMQLVAVYPMVLPRLHGCATLWNIGIRYSDATRWLVLNDDIRIDPSDFLVNLAEAVQALQKQKLVVINESWSHFLISEECLNLVGYFDERFLGFGDEDGDYSRRYKNVFGDFPRTLQLEGFINYIDPSRDESIAAGISKYSLFNSCFFQFKYELLDTTSEVFSAGEKLIDCGRDQKEISSFRREFYPLLTETDRLTILSRLREFYNARSVDDLSS